MDQISEVLKRHYRATYYQHGNTSQGVDWGADQINVYSRHEAMLECIHSSIHKKSLLDVGCGYGALLETINRNRLNIDYTGIDLVEEMIVNAARRMPEQNWICSDFMEWRPDRKYDYVVANGILTQKLSASTLAMNKYAQALILKMFEVCRIGISFNLMSTFVNFQKDNLYYRCPAEMLAWCMAEVSPHARLNASYKPWYEYTVTLFRGINS